jgi:hypothetical protein
MCPGRPDWIDPNQVFVGCRTLFLDRGSVLGREQGGRRNDKPCVLRPDQITATQSISMSNGPGHSGAQTKMRAGGAYHASTTVEVWRGAPREGVRFHKADQSLVAVWFREGPPGEVMVTIS